MMNKKPVNFIALFFLVCFVVACACADNTMGSSNASDRLENLAKSASSKTTHEDGWTIVSKIENGDRVYWFFAPEIDNVSPAMFKKTIYNKDKSKQGFEVVSECEAAKQVCDELTERFKILSKKYN